MFAVRCCTAVVLLAVLTFSSEIHAQPPRRSLPRQAVPVSVPPLLDDASLNDVQFVGQRRGWSVGDRGVIWRTDDGGGSWQLLISGVNCPLRSACFLTDRVGWIVGGGITPHVGTSYGVVLATSDGGNTWTPLADGQLPLLHLVRFFDLEEGMAVCEATARFPSGVIRTSDGGKTWEPLPGDGGEGWRTGDFVDPDRGFVAGRLGRFTSVGGGQVTASQAGASGLRGIADVTLQSDGRGWLAGDGGLVLQTYNGGVSWRPAEGELPRTLRDVMDFGAIATRGEHVWIAGRPGSVIWHSPDGGRSWSAQSTAITTPISALHFATETHGWAVGELGTIISTVDGGRTWTPSRAADRRAAILAIHAHESRVSLNLLTKYGGEEAYRTAVTLVSRRDIGPDGDTGRTLDLRLQDAVTMAGGAGSSVDWAFPVAAPELDHHPKELIREWQLLTDNRLREVMLARLVVQLRSWRPDVLIVDVPPEDDATTALLGDAIRIAVREAAREQDAANLAGLLHLPPWQLQRAYRRLPAGSEGDVAVDAFEFLPRLGASIAMSAANAVGVLGVPMVTEARREAYELWPLEGLAAETPGRDFFAGLVLQPGRDARRELAAIDDRQLDKRQSLADQQRNFTAYARTHLDDERHAAQIIGQTKDIVGAAPPEQAVVQLASLSEEYLLRGQWEHAQTTLFEIVERYPDQPAALEAMRWLFHFTASTEVGWQRLRASSSAQRTEVRVDQNIVQASVREAIDRVRQDRPAEDEANRPSVVQQTSDQAELQYGGGIDQRAAKVSQWRSQAQRLAETIQRANPAFFDEPSFQFPLAALERQLKHPREADLIVSNFLRGSLEQPWSRIASGEVWLTQPATAAPGKVALCHHTAEVPYLDGLLTDICWQNAIRVPLRSEAEHQQVAAFDDVAAEDRPFVQLAYDTGFLYVAAQFPRTEGVPVSPLETPGRHHDADLSGEDRLLLQLDVDRDYATFYRLDVDQRGWTADACWENETWNCERYIAMDANSRTWRIEMAIPLTELVSQPPQRGETWAIGIVRVMPTVGVQSWSLPAGTKAAPQGFGLLRFE